jgi:hypothetical protein
MQARQLTALLVTSLTVLTWVYSIGLRFPYMDQIPVYDADVETAITHMWVRIWWDEGPLKMWFSTPLAPRSIEAPVRTLYESWPPGAFVPIYLIAKFLGMPPSIPMVNWVNAVMHGLIALAAALTAFNLALVNRMGNLAGALIAVAVTFPILLSRGPVFIFSQIYDVVTGVLVYTAIFILLETHFYCSQSQSKKRMIGVLQLLMIFLAFFVDWLSYTLFAFWLLSRIVAGYLGVEDRITLRRLAGFVVIPVSAFSIYLFWRLRAPDATARSGGIWASMGHLAFKVMERMNLTETSHISTSAFGRAFVGEMHWLYYSDYAFPLIVGSAMLTSLLVVITFRRAREPAERRTIFATGSILFLVIVPFYAHMLILYQHTFIHRWAIMKAMFAYALVPFALLPIVIFTLVRQSAGENVAWRSFACQALALILAVCAIISAEAISTEDFFLIGRVDRTAYLMWDDIGRNTRYQDIVVSPVLEANPMSQQIGASYKLVHLAKDFAEVDKLVDHVCGDFNVVLALPEGADASAFAAREPNEVVDTGRIRLLRFAHYQGKRVSCS